jgi:diaminopimelate epimerase
MSQPAQLRRPAHTAGRRRAPAVPVPGMPRHAMSRGTTEVDFVKLSPTCNTTLLVTSRHPVRQYRAIAEKLLRAEHVHAEQVGFILPAESPEAQVRLHMAGDEFCANATMALAALHAATQGLDGPVELRLEASGAADLLDCRVERQDSGYRCQLANPLPIRIDPYPFPGAPSGAAMVRYADAVHLVIECSGRDAVLRERAEQAAAQLGNSEDVSVVGVMLYDPVLGELAPLINVPALGSLVWEGSCGSGTASLGAYLAAKAQAPVSAAVRQPGGTMHVQADYGCGKVTGLRVTGQVAIVAEGTAYVHG